jgi:hypothetical protein
MKKVLAMSAVAIVAVTLATHAASSRRLVVHEWGTFLAMSGSDGVTLDGMYHEEHALPRFVHSRGANELRLPTSLLKGETPVIYFYTDTETRVSVEVGFPGGLWTQWYPQATTLAPRLVQVGTLPEIRNSRIGWTVDVVPAHQAAASGATLPATERDALWNHAREVDAAFVRVIPPQGRNEWERFIFYRGLGQKPLPLHASGNGARLNCAAPMTEAVRHVFVLRVERGEGAYRYVPSLDCGGQIDHLVPAMTSAQPLEQFAGALSDDLAHRLEESGLYAKEARAMVNTWRSSYFTSDGIRILFVLPQSWTDAFIPMKITPPPDELVRVMVGRLELLTPEREREMSDAISRLSSPDAGVREAAFNVLREQGRYVEPMIRRTLQTSTDEQVRAICRRLLLTDFVTDLRTSLTNAADGRPMREDPAFVRAQLAHVLREMGLEHQAKKEAALALEALAKMPAPKMTDHGSRNSFRALARAHEAAGNDAEAFKWYGDFVEFGSTYRGCGGCHQFAGPVDNTFFRDWWAGRRYAQLAVKSGDAPRLIETSEAALGATPGSLLTQIRLGYLYEATGETAKARAIWQKVEGR